MKTTLSRIEPLESRIAPASVFTFTDIDGDLITVTASKGDLSAAGVLTFNTAADVPRQLQKIDLSGNANFLGTDLTVTAKRGPVGDGVTAVGFIDASAAGGGAALDLGKVTIDGDLGRILAGTSATLPSVKALTVGSIGVFGVTTQAAGGDLESTLTGQLGALTITTDLVDGSLLAGGIGAVKVGGSIRAGKILTNGEAIGSILVGGDIVGGVAVDSGSISTVGGEVKTFILRGSLIGGAGIGSGRFFPGKVGSITIGGDIRAGTIVDSGKIENNAAPVGSIMVRGSIFSNALSGTSSGNIGVGDVGSVFIGGSIESATQFAGSLSVGKAKAISVGSLRGGFVIAAEVGALTIRGDVIGNASDSFTAIPVAVTPGQISVTGDVKQKLTIGGDLVGGAGDNSAIVSIGGAAASVSVSGSIIGDAVSAGTARIFVNGKIGAITVGGSIVGGGVDSAKLLTNGGFGSVRVGGDVLGGSGDRSGEILAVGGSGCGALFIGGSLRGAKGDFSARIASDQGFGNITVLGDVAGGGVNAGEGDDSGSIEDVSGNSAIGNITIGGSIRGGAGDRSGALIDLGNGFTGGANALVVRGSILGGGGDFSGHLEINEGGIGAVTVRGRIEGGAGADSGLLNVQSAVGKTKLKVFLAGDIRGASGPGSRVLIIRGNLQTLTVLGSVIGGTTDLAGRVEVDDNIGSVFIGGSIVAGTGTFTGDVELDDSVGVNVTIKGDIRGGTVQAAGRLLADGVKKLTIGGSVIAGGSGGFEQITLQSVADFSIGGNLRGSAANPARIFVKGDRSDVGADPNDLLIGKLTVGGNVEFAQILAGFTALNVLTNSDAQIGTVKVAGDWTASDLSASIQTGVGNRFGDANDTFVAALDDLAAKQSRIASITIGGRVRGTAAGGDHFGFVAQQIGAFKLAGEAITLRAAAPADVVEVFATGDVTVREV